jgi:hypothetical protein
VNPAERQVHFDLVGSPREMIRQRGRDPHDRVGVGGRVVGGDDTVGEGLRRSGGTAGVWKASQWVASKRIIFRLRPANGMPIESRTGFCEKPMGLSAIMHVLSFPYCLTSLQG